MTLSTRISGSIRALKDSHGFIAGDDGQNYFFHWSSMVKGTKDFRELEIRDRLSFIPKTIEIEGQTKLRAIEVVWEQPQLENS